MSETIAERIKRIRQEKGMTQKDLADAVGLTQVAISHIEGNPKRKSFAINKIADALGVSAYYLQTGNEESRNELPQNFKRVYIVGWNDAIYINEQVAPPKTDNYIYSNLNFSPNSYVLRIENEANAPLFRPNDLILIDPMRAPSPSNYVIADINGIIAFRQFRQIDLIRFELIPHNPLYATLNNTDNKITILGVAISHRKSLL